MRTLEFESFYSAGVSWSWIRSLEYGIISSWIYCTVEASKDVVCSHGGSRWRPNIFFLKWDVWWGRVLGRL